VELFDIPLGDVVDAFVAEVAAWESVDLATLSEFLVVAAVLIELKSKRLLPGSDDIEPDEELVGWEERDVLLARLLECQAYVAAADAFAILFEQAARSVPRTAGLDPDLVVHAPDLLDGVTPDDLAAAFLRATAERPVPTVDLYHVTVDTVTVADAVTELVRRLPRLGRATFRSLTEHLTTRIEVIVRFLALLELCKQGRVSLDQGHTFGDLEVAWLADREDRVPVGAGVTDEYEG
jgi:segregation and condensation protein A